MKINVAFFDVSFFKDNLIKEIDMDVYTVDFEENIIEFKKNFNKIYPDNSIKNNISKILVNLKKEVDENENNIKSDLDELKKYLINIDGIFGINLEENIKKIMKVNNNKLFSFDKKYVNFNIIKNKKIKKNKEYYYYFFERLIDGDSILYAFLNSLEIKNGK